MRGLKNTLLAVILFCSGKLLANGDLIIFDVRKSLTMRNDQKVYQDFYINAGKSKGLKKGMIIPVTRRKALYDNYQNRSPGDLIVTIAQVKLIHVQDTISVGRLYRENNENKRPVLEFDYILVGDRLDLSAAYMPKRKPQSVRKRVDVEIETDTKKPVDENRPMAQSFPHIFPEKPKDLETPIL